MEIHQLRYFVAVAEEKSFSRAAERVRVAQPSLSQQIQKLERELGQPLFDRLSRRVILTEAGTGFLPFAQRILNELSSAQRYVNDSSRTPAGAVTMGVLPTIAPFISEVLLARSAERLAEVRLALVEDVTDNLSRMVDSGEVDFAVISSCQAGPAVFLERWAAEPLFLASTGGGRFAKRKKVHWTDLRRETVLLMHESHCLSRQIQKACTQHRVPCRRVSVLQLPTLLSLVASGAGVTLAPRMAVEAGFSSGCEFTPFGGAVPARDINALRNLSHYQSKAAMAVSEIAREVISEMLNRPFSR